MSFLATGSLCSRTPACSSAELSLVDFHATQLVCKRTKAARVLAPGTPSAGPGSNPISLSRICSSRISSRFNGRTVLGAVADPAITGGEAETSSDEAPGVVTAGLSKSVSELSDMTQPVTKKRQKGTMNPVLFTTALSSRLRPMRGSKRCAVLKDKSRQNNSLGPMGHTTTDEA